MILYSIIIPVYNAERYLARCIQSVLDQTCKNWELILVNDGSKDSSGRICDEFASKDSRIIVIHKGNGGVSSARNTGIERAFGDWISFIDSDDWVDKTYLEDFGLREDTFAGSIFIQGIGFTLSDGRNVPDLFSYPNTQFYINDFSKIKSYEVLKNGCPVAKLFNREMIINKGLHFNEDLSFNEDHLFVTDYFRYVSKVVLLDKVNYHYYFDFKVESLTKKKRSTDEYLQISSHMSSSLYLLCEQLHTQPSKICTDEILNFYGLGQLVSASLRSIHEKESLKRYSTCIKEYKLNTVIQGFRGIDAYSRLFIKCAKHERIVFGYVAAFIYSNICMLYRLTINIIKKYILRR